MVFPYFGNKIALIDDYPKPLHDLIVEPFCGSARYAVKYGLTRDVWINDKYKVIYDIWVWIRSASKSDIYGLPKLKSKGDSLENIKSLSEPERNLLGFATGVGRAQPCNKISAFGSARDGTVQLRKALLRLCGRISHWRITNWDYSKITNKQASWYIDPPYQFFGHHYKHNEKSIDFKHLGQWCLERKGQVMVCEAGKANWLPFVPLKKNIRRLQRKDDYREVWYYQSDVKGGFGLL